MTKSTKKALAITFGILVGVAAIVGTVLLVKHLTKEPERAYEPIEAFRPAYEAIISQAEEAVEAPEYDIEQTVRILNGMELAQTQSEDFTSFLRYMAEQNYDGVAPEVLEAKKKLFPILQDLFTLQQEYENLNFWKGIVTKVGNQYCSDAQVATTVDSDDDSSINPLYFLDPSVGLSIGLMQGITSGTQYAFQQYQEELKLKGEVKKKIQKVEMDYITYLEEFTPVYVKYMKEWDQLCLKKDKAYMSVYKGMPSEAYATCIEILEQNPNNREAMLLKSLALVQMHNRKVSDTPINITFGKELDSISNAYLAEAQWTLSQYIEEYPDCSAPALLLQGQIDLIRGDKAHAFMNFDQASMEYPRQAAHLTDMLDSYRVRTYLSSTAEGADLLQMYQSTMEGFGLFSPNLIKAMCYEQEGDFNASREEIFKHFFRRSNQGVYDCLTLDMEFCEEHLFASFKQLLPESSYIDVSVKKSRSMLGMKKENNKLNVVVSNRSDRDLQNLRIFLCVHFTDMYTSDNYIIKVPTINRIPVYENAEVEDIEWNYMNKSFNDITRIRAIAMTDNSICWVDNVFNAEDGIDYNEAHRVAETKLEAGKAHSIDSYLKSIRQDKSTIVKAIKEESHLAVEQKTKNFKKIQTLKVDLPRIVAFLNPAFFLDETILPTANYIRGSYVHVEFEVPQEDKEYKLIMNSEYIRSVITLQVIGNTITIRSIDSNF